MNLAMTIRDPFPVVSIRSSSWGGLFDCAHKWEGQNLLGMRMPSSPRAHLGTSIHHSTAVFDQAKMDKADLRVEDAADTFIDALLHPDYEVLWDEDLTRAKAEVIGLKLHTRYCLEISPLYQYKAIELRPDPLLIDVPEYKVTIELTGQMDRSRIRTAEGGISISDLKTGAARVNADGVVKIGSDWIQLGIYEMLAEFSLGENITGNAEIIGLQTTNAANIGIGEIVNARRGLIGVPEQPGLIQMAAQIVSSGLFPPNPQSYLCSEKYCARYPTCNYHN
jgi:hypothetical protein